MYQEASVFSCPKVFACIKHSYLYGNGYAPLCCRAFLYGYLQGDLDSQLAQSVLFPQQLMTRNLHGRGRYAKDELGSTHSSLSHMLPSCFLPFWFVADNSRCHTTQSHTEYALWFIFYEILDNFSSVKCQFSDRKFTLSWVLFQKRVNRKMDKGHEQPRRRRHKKKKI